MAHTHQVRIRVERGESEGGGAVGEGSVGGRAARERLGGHKWGFTMVMGSAFCSCSWRMSPLNWGNRNGCFYVSDVECL